MEQSSYERTPLGLADSEDGPLWPPEPRSAGGGRRRSGVGGMLLLVPGLAALLAVLVLQTTSIAQAVVVAVPVALVGLGLERLGRAAGIRGLRPVGVLVLLLALAGPAVMAARPPGPVERVTVRSAVPPEAQEAVMRAAMGAGQLRVRAGGPGLIEADLRSSGRPVTAVSTGGDAALVDLRAPSQQGLLARNRGSDWTTTLTSALPWRIELDAGAVTADLDLHQVNLRALRVSGGTPSRVAVRLGVPAGRTQVDIRLSAGVLDLYLPADAGLELELSGAVVRDLDGLQHVDRVWRTGSDPGRAYVIRADVGVGAVRVHRG
jgi:hypothetical protein